MKFLVPLQDLFYLLRCVVMLLAYDQRIKDAGGRFQRVYGRIDTEFRDLAAEDGCRVQVRKGSRRSRVRLVIGRNIHRLYGGDGALLG